MRESAPGSMHAHSLIRRSPTVPRTNSGVGRGNGGRGGGRGGGVGNIVSGGAISGSGSVSSAASGQADGVDGGLLFGDGGVGGGADPGGWERCNTQLIPKEMWADPS